MSTVIFESERAIFHLNLRDVSASLQDYSSCGRVKDAADLVNILEASSSEPKRIPSEKGFFGYILLDVFSKNKGSVSCKACQKTYPKGGRRGKIKSLEILLLTGISGFSIKGQICQHCGGL